MGENSKIERRGMMSGKAKEAASGLNDGLGALLPCPFCGKPGEFIRKQYHGTGASGMEPDFILAGCPTCKVMFGGMEERGWSSGKGWFDQSKVAHVHAAELWNRRA